MAAKVCLKLLKRNYSDRFFNQKMITNRHVFIIETLSTGGTVARGDGAKWRFHADQPDSSIMSFQVLRAGFVNMVHVVNMVLLVSVRNKKSR